MGVQFSLKWRHLRNKNIFHDVAKLFLWNIFVNFGQVLCNYFVVFVFHQICRLLFHFTFLTLGKCPSDSLSCDNGTKCIPRKFICDFKYDCRDKQDEKIIRCGDFRSIGVINDNYEEGIKINEALMQTHNLTDSDEIEDFCSKVMFMSFKNLTAF